MKYSWKMFRFEQKQQGNVKKVIQHTLKIREASLPFQFLLMAYNKQVGACKFFKNVLMPSATFRTNFIKTENY